MPKVPILQAYGEESECLDKPLSNSDAAAQGTHRDPPIPSRLTLKWHPEPWLGLLTPLSNLVSMKTTLGILYLKKLN